MSRLHASLFEGREGGTHNLLSIAITRLQFLDDDVEVGFAQIVPPYRPVNFDLQEEFLLPVIEKPLPLKTVCDAFEHRCQFVTSFEDGLTMLEDEQVEMLRSIVWLVIDNVWKEMLEICDLPSGIKVRW